MTQLITVFGATGNQGGSVVKAFLADSQWKVRGVTRDPSKPAAKELATKGVEVVSADADDKTSVEKAIAGSTVVFGVTNYWEYLDGARELRQGKNMADAVKAAGVPFFIFSSLPHVERLTKGVFKNVYHFDFKAKVQDYIQFLGIPAAFYQPAVFYSNNKPGSGGFIQRVDDKWVLAAPIPESSVIASIDVVADTGTIVKAMVNQRNRISGQVVAGISRLLTLAQYRAGLKAAFPAHDFPFHEMTDEEFKAALTAKGSPDKVALEMVENMAQIRDFRYYGPDEEALYKKTLELVGGEDKLTDWPTYIKNEPAFSVLRE